MHFAKVFKAFFCLQIKYDLYRSNMIIRFMLNHHCIALHYMFENYRALIIKLSI